MTEARTSYEQRSERLAGALAQDEVDLVLITDLANVRYLTGYTGSNGIALIGPQRRTFITDFRYVEQAAEEVAPAFERRRAPQELLEDLATVLDGQTLRLGFEDHDVSVRRHHRLRQLLAPEIELVPLDGAVERVRAVKTNDEVARIRAAAELADEVLRNVLEGGLIGRTEREVALELEAAMLRLGADRPSFDAIVAAGPNGALPHAHPRDAEIEAGRLVVIDWGARLDGYCSDCTRTVATGAPTDEMREVYELTLRAQLASLEAVRTGAHGREVDSVARDIITAAGYGDNFGHGLGHGVGMAVHEAPRLSQSSDSVLAAGNIVTVEPGIYLPGRLGVRIEDLVVVADEGPEVLTTLPKELLVIG